MVFSSYFASFLILGDGARPVAKKTPQRTTCQYILKRFDDRDDETPVSYRGKDLPPITPTKSPVHYASGQNLPSLQRAMPPRRVIAETPVIIAKTLSKSRFTIPPPPALVSRHVIDRGTSSNDSSAD